MMPELKCKYCDREITDKDDRLMHEAVCEKKPEWEKPEEDSNG